VEKDFLVSPLSKQGVFILQNLAEKRAKLLLLFALFSVHNLWNNYFILSLGIP
jgi:hypothetical protein